MEKFQQADEGGIDWHNYRVREGERTGGSFSYDVVMRMSCRGESGVRVASTWWQMELKRNTVHVQDGFKPDVT
jgi:hypothetical protein